MLALAYLATLAPGLTLWDAGEFQSAVATLGIPHPPGAPLYVLVARVWTWLWPEHAFTLAMNLLSAISSAVMGGGVAWLFARWTRSGSVGIAAGVSAGLVYSVWQNATETEVYALSLLLGVLMLVVGERAAEGREGRWNALLAYCLGLAASLHLDALLAAPAAILLATAGVGQRVLQLRAIAPWGAPVLLALGLGGASPLLVGLAVSWLIVVIAAPLPGARTERTWQGLRWMLLVALGASSALFMLVRAAHDPGVNQGNPSDWHGFLSVLARDQYDVPGLWPRRAPLWLQVGNMLQYLDWQFAYGIDSRTTFSFLRAPVTSFFVALAWVGARAHWERDPRSARAWLAYLFIGAFGAMLVLNLQAGPSIGWGILPEDAGHEARERDYFFVVAFAGLVAWAVAGARELVSRRSAGVRRVVPLALPALLFALNFSATNRRHEPDASLPAALAGAIFASAPPNAVVLLAGDNDSYAVWHGQHVQHLRTDLVPVTLPLLGADWYRQELRSRYGLLSGDAAERWQGLSATLRALRDGSVTARRPFTALVSVDAAVRDAVASSWSLRGLVFVWNATPTTPPLSIDSATPQLARALAGSAGAPMAHDPTGRYLQRLLRCPLAAVAMRHDSLATGSLDSICNFR